MRLLYTLIILSTIFWWSEAKPNPCCSNNKPYIPKKGCMDNGTSWLKEVKCQAYRLKPDLDNYKIRDDDTLVIADVAEVPQNRYCVGSKETENNTIVLVCFPDEKAVGSDRIILIICMILSILSLVLTLGVYCILPKLRDLQGKCIMLMVLSLLIANAFLVMVQRVTQLSNGVCYFVALSIYFWFLSTFLWMNVNCFHIWRSIVNPAYPKNEKKVFKIYNGYGWGCSLIILIIANLAYHIPGDHIKPTWTAKSCWFSDFKSAMIYFEIPILILLSLNVILFILSAWALRRQQNLPDNNLRSRKYRFVLYLKLFLIMGICWIFEPIEMFLNFEFLSTVWLVTNIINASQGVVIFLLLVVFRKRVRLELARRNCFCCKKLPENWATMADEDCEEISEETDKLTGGGEINN